MRKLITSLAVIFICTASSFAQDMIYKSNGEKIKCRITQEDSTYVTIKTMYDDNYVNTRINRSDIDSILYKKDIISTEKSLTSSFVGIGIGLEYGGIGTNYIIQPTKNVGLFFGLGFALSGVGYNCGTKIRYSTRYSKYKNTINPYSILMYGYNSAIYVSGGEGHNKLFYGPSVGFGIDIHSPKRKSGFWSFAINMPIRSNEVDSYITELEDKGVNFNNKLLPITFSVGFRIH